jgi:uncharacterized membrane protein
MTDTDASRLRDDYLSRLDAAMRELPHGVASEIRAGVAEELAELDADATAQRIAQLGDPRQIAREAQSETPGTVAPIIVDGPAKEPVTRSRGFAITAALVLAFGGFGVPVIGWFVGAVMVTMSSLWHRWEKVVALTLPFVVLALVAVGTLVVRMAASNETDAPEHNPLLPASYDLWNSSILLVFVLIPVVGGWLLWRLRRR